MSGIGPDRFAIATFVRSNVEELRFMGRIEQCLARIVARWAKPAFVGGFNLMTNTPETPDCVSYRPATDDDLRRFRDRWSPAESIPDWLEQVAASTVILPEEFKRLSTIFGEGQ